MTWYLFGSFGRVDHIRCVVPVTILCFLWCARNESKFQGIAFSLDKIIFKIDCFLYLLGSLSTISVSQLKGDENSAITAWFTVSSGSPTGLHPVCWISPSNGFKLYTDASVKNGMATGAGLV